jgi:YcxB-like protein
MELTYRLTREDHQLAAKLSVARVRRHARQATSWYLRPGVITVAAALIGILPLVYLLFAGLLGPAGYFLAIFGYAWGTLCMGLCGRLVQRQYLDNWLPEDSLSLSEVHLKLVSDGIEVSDRFRTGKYLWQAFGEVSEEGDFVLLWFDRARGLPIPNRAFANADARQSFIATLRGHLASTPA